MQTDIAKAKAEAEARTKRGKRLEAMAQRLLAVVKDECKTNSQEDFTFAMQGLVAATFIVMTNAYPNLGSRKEFMQIYTDNLDEIIRQMTPLTAN